MKRLVGVILAISCLMTTLFSCKDEIEESPKYQINDSILGFFGNVKVYDEYGEELSSAGVEVRASRFADVDSSVCTDTIFTITDELGEYKFIDCLGGFYNIQYSKDGFVPAYISGQSHDTLDADTLPTVILSKVVPAKIKITEFYYDTLHFEITRRVDFTAPSDKNYFVVCHYFFDTTENVSSTNFVGHFISGAIQGIGGSSNVFTIQKTQNYIINSNEKLAEGHQIYICAYPENLHYAQYIDFNGQYLFPSLGEKSNVLSYPLEKLMFPH